MAFESCQSNPDTKLQAIPADKSGILHRGYKTSFHFRSLPTEISLIISIEMNGSLFPYHNYSLFVFCHHLISIYIYFTLSFHKLILTLIVKNWCK